MPWTTHSGLCPPLSDRQIVSILRPAAPGIRDQLPKKAVSSNAVFFRKRALFINQALFKKHFSESERPLFRKRAFEFRGGHHGIRANEISVTKVEVSFRDTH